MTDAKKRSVLEGVRNWFLLLLFFVLLAVFTVETANICISRQYFAVEVVGDSMKDTLQTGDVVYAGYGAEPLARGEIVIIDVSENPSFSSGNIIKRLIAVGGESVKCEGGVVYVRPAGGAYEALEEPYVKGVTFDFGEVTLGEGEIFVMGDNREVSHDSRALPPERRLKVSDILGIVADWSLESESMVGWWEGIRTLFTRPE